MNVKKGLFVAGIGYEDRDNFSAALNRMELVVGEYRCVAWVKNAAAALCSIVVVVETFMF